MGDGTGGANTADSYIGSLISLTSKSEIRYEGILYMVDTENSNIALQNVRSFGTEGRKKDGPPIYASDKVYEYIVFRGSDIKDLQVKSSPSVQPPPQQPPADPAIVSLQSQSSQPASIPSAYVQPPPPGPQDAPPQLSYPGLPPAAFRPGVPQMYQPTAAWAPPAGPNGNLAMPMYWHGYYRPPPRGQLLPQQMPPQPPPSLPQPPIPQAHGVQQISSRPSPPLNLNNSISLSSQLQAFGSSPPASTAIPGVIGSVSSVPPAPVSNSSQAPIVSSLTSLAGNVPSAPVVPPSSVPSAVPIVPPASIAPPVAIVPPAAVVPAAAIVPQAAVAPTVTTPVSVPAALQGVSAVITPASKNPRRVVGTVQPTPPQSQSSGASVGSSSVPLASPSLHSASSTLAQRSQAATQAFPGGMLVPGKGSGPNPLKQEQKAAELLNPQSTASQPAQTLQRESQPLLPLPAAPNSQRQGNGTVAQTYVRRGRGRGTGSGRGVGVAHPMQQFTEDFDFTAMNEKFNKDAVWGVLGGKGDKVTDAEVEEFPEGNVEDDIPDGPAQKGPSDVPKMPTYVKDDFFDSLSCDALDREEGRAERTKFSEQRKLDTETFGTFPLRSRGGRRGGRRGGFRGGYYNSNGAGGFVGGRGNTYGRGRGSRPATAIN